MEYRSLIFSGLHILMRRTYCKRGVQYMRPSYEIIFPLVSGGLENKTVMCEKCLCLLGPYSIAL